MFTLKASTSMTILLLYVKDIVLTASTITLLHKFISLLKTIDLGSLNYFFEILITKNS